MRSNVNIEMQIKNGDGNIFSLRGNYRQIQEAARFGDITLSTSVVNKAIKVASKKLGLKNRLAHIPSGIVLQHIF
ncbi:MAG: hypothetical protein HYW12_05070 [Planctomycetes bacterium]|nr:hypothetical protein [Planctomycetota bacterium]